MGSHQSGAQAGEPYQDKGHPSASGAKARRDPQTDPCDNRQCPTHTPKALCTKSSGGGGGGRVLPNKTRTLPGQFISAPSEPPAQQKAF